MPANMNTPETLPGRAPLSLVAALRLHWCGAQLLDNGPAAPWCPRCQCTVPVLRGLPRPSGGSDA